MKSDESNSFACRVRNMVKAIPVGSVMAYGAVAAAAGSPRAARAVGIIMSKNYDPDIPCHRVVRSDGQVGDYNRGGASEKTKLLQDEGALPK